MNIYCCGVGMWHGSWEYDVKLTCTDQDKTKVDIKRLKEKQPVLVMFIPGSRKHIKIEFQI